MRIGLNLLHARPLIGGGWQYIGNLLNALAHSDQDCEFVAYCSAASAELVPADRRFEIRKTRLVTAWQPGRVLYEQTILVAIARRDRLDCMHWFAVNQPLVRFVPGVVTLYDCLFLERSESFSSMQRFYLRHMARFACGRARVVAAISESTAQAAMRLLGVPCGRIVVVANPVDGSFSPAAASETRELRERFRLPDAFWLYVAHPYAHKNHLRLLAAYRQYLQAGGPSWPLVLRGDRKANWREVENAIRELDLSEKVIWLPNLSIADMTRLYSAATALIFPSLYEGCGQPVVEAMACGCPVAASDIPTNREFGGPAVIRFDAQKVDEIAGAMNCFSTDVRLREHCREEGLARARIYSRESTARNLLQAYRQAAFGPVGRQSIFETPARQEEQPGIPSVHEVLRRND
jgi:glycosyltransferase involved in cell wall biosynthesis